MEKIETQLVTYHLDVIKKTRLDQNNHPATNLSVRRVPVVNLFCRGLCQNIFCSVLLQVHGFFPYVFVQYQMDQDINAWRQSLITSIERAVQNYYPKIAQQITCVVHDCQVVKGIPMLGYHQDQLFAKILLTEWNLVSIVARLLQSGQCGREYLVYESHINDFVKFSIDIGINNNIINCQGIKVGKKYSTCDFEFQTTVEFILQNRENIRVQTQQLSPQLKGALMLQQINVRNNIISETQYESSDSVQQVQFSEKEDNDSDNDENLTLDVKGILDGGFNSELSESENQFDEQNYIPFQTGQDLSIKDNSIQILKYSNLNDVPNTQFEWAGQKYYFSNDTGLVQNGSTHFDDLSEEQKQEEKRTPDIIDLEENISNFYFSHSVTQLPFILRKQEIVIKNEQYTHDNEQIHIQKELISEITTRISNQQSQQSIQDFLQILHTEPMLFNMGVQYIYYNSDSLYQFYSNTNQFEVTYKIGFFLYTDSFIISEQTSKQDIIKQTLISILNKQNITKYQIDEIIFSEEKDILTNLLPDFCQKIDPDIIISHKAIFEGIGKIAIEAAKFNFDFLTKISRTPFKQSHFFQKQKNVYKFFQINGAFENAFTQHKQISGRLIFSVQSIARQLLKLDDHSIFNIYKQIGITINPLELNFLEKLFQQENQKIDIIDNILHFRELSSQQMFSEISITVEQVLQNSVNFLTIQRQFVQKTGFLQGAQESSKLYQIPIFETLTRGSQFKINAMLQSICRQRNIIIGPTPTLKQVSQMKALEALPLVSEPKTMYYSLPVLVFDFASLYPSVMATYNLCYTTILKNFKHTQQIGPFQLNFHKNELKDLDITSVIFSPSNCVFVKPTLRLGVIPQLMLNCLKQRSQINQKLQTYQQDLEILENGIHHFKNSSELTKLQQLKLYLLSQINKLNAKQLELKMLMNTTYGYTAATFSGKMPVAELGDSIMQISRQVLEWAIQIVEKQFVGCKVVYSDTDSMFIDMQELVKNLNQNFTDSQLLLLANKIGGQILNAINKELQSPMKIKFERIYFPSILLAKKRYVGKSYNPQVVTKIDQQINYQSLINNSQLLNDIQNIIQSNFKLETFTYKIDAKGIESIRRDVPIFVQNAIVTTLDILFKTSDLSLVKTHLIEIFFQSVLNFDPQKFIIHKKFHGSKKAQMNQFFIENLQIGEYYHYLVTEDSQFVPPHVFSKTYSDGSQPIPNYIYYVEKLLLPSLQRILGVCGINVEKIWAQVAQSIMHLPAQEEFTVQFQRNSRFCGQKYSILTPQTAPNIPPSLFTFSTIQPTESTLFPPKRPKSDILLYRPKQRCICCRSAQILSSKSISICKNCTENSTILRSFTASNQRKLDRILAICRQCGGVDETGNLICQNFRCPVLFEVGRSRALVVQYEQVLKVVQGLEGEKCKIKLCEDVGE